MVARQDAFDLAALGIDADIRPQSIHHVDGLGLGQLPGPRGEGVGLVGQRADRAEVDDVALHLALEDAAQVVRDLGVFATADLAQLGDARHLGDDRMGMRVPVGDHAAALDRIADRDFAVIREYVGYGKWPSQLVRMVQQAPVLAELRAERERPAQSLDRPIEDPDTAVPVLEDRYAQLLEKEGDRFFAAIVGRDPRSAR